MRITEIVALASEKLHDITDSPRLDAELLLAHAQARSRTWIVTHAEDVLPDSEQQAFWELIDRRLAGEPVAYILGHREFWTLDLAVTSATLVPRPETERLVEVALEFIRSSDHQRIADLGTGSGAIALAIASERPECHVTASDLSDAALEVARENARRLNIDNVDFVHSDWTESLHGQPFDLVVSNPPYVASGDEALKRLHAEPDSALESGPEGMDDIRKLAAEVREILKLGGHFLVEHGADQETLVHEALIEHGWKQVHCYRDLAGHPRVTSAIFRG